MISGKVPKACRTNGDDYQKVVYRLVVVEFDGLGCIFIASLSTFLALIAFLRAMLMFSIIVW